MGLSPSGRFARRHSGEASDAPSLRYADHCILLVPGTLLFGRSPICNFCFDEPLVSRRHAELEVKAHEVVFRDLQSVNGVYVNEQRVAGSYKLKHGDTLRIGRQELVFELGLPPHARVIALDASKRTLGCMLITGLSAASAITPTHFPAITQAEHTRQTAVLELVARAAEPLFLAGKTTEAEGLLSGHLERVLREQRLGRTVDDDTFLSAVQLSLKLTVAGAGSKWFDHAVALLSEKNAVCSERLASDFREAISAAPSANRAALHDYAHALRELKPTSLEHLASAQRIEEIADFACERSLIG